MIGGTTFALADVQAFAATNGVVNTGQGTLTLTGYTGDAMVGSISYSYTLDATIDNDSVVPTGDDAVTLDNFDDSVAISVAGISGTTASDDLVIRIVDDTPTANDDGPEAVTEDGTSYVEGDVLSNDDANADQAAAFVGWSGADAATVATLNSFGTLVQNSNGTWSYTLDNSLATTQALTAADSTDYVLNYTMADADGDQTNASLTITLNGTDDNASAGISVPPGPVYEAGLSPDGSNAASDSEFTTGSFQVSATDGILTVVVGGLTFTYAEILLADGTATYQIDTGEGILSLTGYTGDEFGGTVSFSYELSATIDNDDYIPTGDDSVTATNFFDRIDTKVNGIGGTMATAVIVIDVVNDIPTISQITPVVISNEDTAYAEGLVSFLSGADTPITVDLSSNVSDWGTDGTYYSDSGLLSGTNIVYYYVDPADTGTLIAYTSPDAGETVGDVIFTATVDPVTGEFSVAMTGKLDAETTDIGAEFNKNIGSNLDYLTIGSDGLIYKPGDVLPNGVTEAIRVDSTLGGVNTSVQGISGDSQWVDKVTEFVTFNFTDSAIDASITIDIKSVQPGAGSGWVEYYVIDANANVDEGYMLITDGVLTEIPTSLTNLTEVRIGYADLTGLQAEHAGATPVEFRVSGISATTSVIEGDVTTSLGVTMTDNDGDSTSGIMDILFEGSATLTGTDGDDALGGSDLSELLIGGAGDDILTGGAGADTFLVYDTLPSVGESGDIVTDFNQGSGGYLGTEGDALDLSDLLSGVDQADLQANLNNYLSIDDNGGNAEVSVDLTGSGSSFTTVAILQGVDAGAISIDLSTLLIQDTDGL